MRVGRLGYEHLTEALGIGTSRPRLSWVIETERPNRMQVAYELLDSAEQSQHSTGKVETGGEESILLPWPFKPLDSRQQLSVCVRIWSADGSASGWSEPVLVEAGLLQPADWTAQFIAPAWDDDTSQPSPPRSCGANLRSQSRWRRHASTSPH